MNRVLIVSSNEKISGQLSQLLQEAGANQVSVAASGGEARRYLSDYQCEFVVINAPLSDEYSGKIEDFAPEAEYCALSARDAEDAYFALFRNSEGKKCVFYFEATARMLKICRMYNPSGTVMSKVRY